MRLPPAEPALVRKKIRVPQKPKPAEVLKGLQQNLKPPLSRGRGPSFIAAIREFMEAERIPGVSLIDGYLKRRAERKLPGMVPRD